MTDFLTIRGHVEASKICPSYRILFYFFILLFYSGLFFTWKSSCHNISVATYSSGKVPLKTSKTFRNKFERGQTDVFTVDAKVGEIEKIR